MEIPLIYYLLCGMMLLIIIQTVSLLLLKKEIHNIEKKVERYLAYILEDDGETESRKLSTEQNTKTGMDERQKEQILQEVLSGFFS